MASLFTPFQQFFDANGSPLISGTLDFFTEGTTNRLDTFSDSSLLNKNANPVVLDGEGKLPNIIFGAGVYKVILRSKPTTISPEGVLIDELDPVGGDAGTKIPFNLWISTTIYNIPNIVLGNNGLFYESTINTNLGNDPTLFPGTNPSWKEVRFIGVFNTTVTYSIGDVVQTTDGILWRSLTDSNTGNNPLTDDGTNWIAQGLSIIDTPTNTSPADSAIDISKTPTLVSSAFSSSTDIHLHSNWQIATDAGFTALVYNVLNNDLETHTIPVEDSLVSETIYFFRVRYVGINGISEFSTGTTFTTEFVFNSLFAITIYTGNGTSQSIISDLDFTTREGLVWGKKRDGFNNHAIFDTVRGATKLISSNNDFAETIDAASLTVFNDDGFSVGSSDALNTDLATYVAWQWIRQPGLLDIIKYTGDSVAGTTLPHNLGTTFGICFIKGLDAATDWIVQHKDLGGTKNLRLNAVSSTSSNPTIWNNTSATSTDITLGDNIDVNLISNEYIAYVFAHAPSKGIFCGSYAGTGVDNPIVTGFQTGFVLIKCHDANLTNWALLDIKRGVTPATLRLQPNINTGDTNDQDVKSWDATGFTLQGVNTESNAIGNNYIFMALADPALF